VDDEKTSRRITPGDWYAVVTRSVSVAVPPSAREKVSRLWDLADTGAGFDELLDALVADGLAAIPSFVLLEHGPLTRLIVRGAAEVVLRAGEERLVVRPDEGAVWTEQVASGVTGGSVVLGEAPADPVPALPLVGELAKVSRIEFGEPEGGEVAELAELAEPEPEGLADEPPALEVVPPLPPAPAPFPPAPAPYPPAPAPFPPAPAPYPPAPTQLPPAPTPFPPAPAPLSTAPPSTVPPAPVPVEEDEDTAIGLTPVDGPRSAPAGAEEPPGVLARPVAMLVVSTGQLVPVDRAILVGRAPEARRFASEDRPALLSVPSPQQEISSTHLEIRPGAGVDHGMAVVTDLGSTNGTVLVQPGLPPEELQAGIAVALIPGAVLDLGDGVTIQVTNP
jgi:hypothetical protein